MTRDHGEVGTLPHQPSGRPPFQLPLPGSRAARGDFSAAAPWGRSSRPLLWSCWQWGPDHSRLVPLAESHRESCASTSGSRDVPGGRPGTRGRGHSSQHEQIPRWLWLPGSVPHEVGGGHPGYSCFPFWVPIPAMGRVKPQEVARSTRLVSAMGVGPAMPLLSARYHSIRYFIPSSHQNAPYASLLN